ncbi:MAG: ABC transporter ATP-binding protein [Nitrospinota bacterium]
MEAITKTFGSLVANRRIDFTLQAGEIHALLGENGAGKTTLVSILYGHYRPDSGSILLDGRPVQLHSSKAAIKLGIGMVPQHFMLVSTFTVAENLLLGLETFHIGPIRLAEAEGRIEEFSRRFGLAIDPKARVEHLSLGERQRVEIIRALFLGARILILDEPTSVLTPLEVEPLLDTLRRLSEQGTSIVLISHKIPEVLTVSHRITVLRDGARVDTVDRAETHEAELARMMVGREVRAHKVQGTPASTEEVFTASETTVLNDLSLPVIRGVSLSLFRGEILGLAGVDGNGQRELAEALAGIRPLESGRILFQGLDLTRLGFRARSDLGIGFVPSDRQKLGLVPDFTVEENLILDSYRRSPISQIGWMSFERIRSFSSDLMKRFGIRGCGLDSRLRQLSGGNQQKVLLARVLSRKVAVLIISQPTSGLDVGATEFVHELLLTLREQGTAILLISTELEEILSLSDRVAVLSAGEIRAVFSKADANRDEIGLLMAGHVSGNP